MERQVLRVLQDLAVPEVLKVQQVTMARLVLQALLALLVPPVPMDQMESQVQRVVLEKLGIQVVPA